MTFTIVKHLFLPKLISFNRNSLSRSEVTSIQASNEGIHDSSVQSRDVNNDHSFTIVFMTEIAEVGARMCLIEGRSNLCKVSLSFQSRREIAYEKSMSQKIRLHL